MKRILLALIFHSCALSGLCFAALVCLALPLYAGPIPLTGTIQDPAGRLLTGRIDLTLSYSAARDTSANNITVATTVSFPVRNGTLPANAQIVPNSALTPGNTTYLAEYYNSFGQKLAENNFYISGTTFNLGTATPTTITTSNISFANGTTTIDCSGISGASASIQVTNCANNLPSTGGTVDGRGFVGSQSWNSDAFSGITKPIDFQCGATVYTVSVTSTIPTNVTLWGGNGCKFKPNAGITLYVDGKINAGETQQIFDISAGGTVTSQAGALQLTAYPHWWGAINDNDSVDSTTMIQAAINFARNLARGASLGSQTKAGRVFIPQGYYAISCLDATGTAGLEIEGKAKWGVTLYADKQASPCPALDLSQSQGVRIRGIDIQGSQPSGVAPSVLPTNHILLSEFNQNQCDANYLENVSTEGHATKDSVFVYGCTDLRFIGGSFSNSELGHYALTIANTNTTSVSSNFGTIITGNQTSGEIDIIGQEIHGANSASATSCATHLSGVYAVRWFGGVHDSSGACQIQFDGTNNTVSIQGTQFFSSSGHAATNGFLLNSGTTTFFTVNNADFQGNGYSGSLMSGSFTRPVISNVRPVSGTVVDEHGALALGAWPSNAANGFIGTSALDQTMTTNYSLLADAVGGTYVNATTGNAVHVRIANNDIALFGGYANGEMLSVDNTNSIVGVQGLLIGGLGASDTVDWGAGQGRVVGLGGVTAANNISASSQIGLRALGGGSGAGLLISDASGTGVVEPFVFCMQTVGNTPSQCAVSNQIMQAGLRATTGGGLLVGSSGTVPATGQLALQSTLATYNNINTVSEGIPYEVAAADQTAQTANIGATTVYAVPASGAGRYRVSCYVVVTATAGVSSTMPLCSVIWTDLDTNIANTVAMTYSSNANTQGTTNSVSCPATCNGGSNVGQGGQFVVNAHASTNIQYSTGGYASNPGTTMQYAVHFRVERMGN